MLLFGCQYVLYIQYQFTSSSLTIYTVHTGHQLDRSALLTCVQPELGTLLVGLLLPTPLFCRAWHAWPSPLHNCVGPKADSIHSDAVEHQDTAQHLH